MNYIANMYDEIKCEYLVTAMRKQLWDKELRIYEEFKRICRKYHLHHFLIGGSALGAERHKGFIPWDDDLDIGMYRDDFDIFINVITNELSEPYSITFGILDNHVSPLLRIRDDSTTGIIKNEMSSLHSKGIFIEIYVYDNIPDDSELRKIQIDKVDNLLYLINFKIKRPQINSKDRLITWLKVLMTTPVALWKKTQKECAKYNNDQTESVNTVLLPVYARMEETLIKRESIKRIVEVVFENSSAFVLEDNDAMLTQCYGDYMQLPSPEKRGTHHDRIVFYDPTRPYTYYETDKGRQLVQDYFTGKYEGILS